MAPHRKISIMAAKDFSVDITTGVGIISFPHVFADTASTNDRGETVYDLQLIIPKSQRADIKALLKAISTVGQDRWGDKWKQVRNPLRDGDKEADELTQDGSTKGEKYPERLGCYFINARSYQPVGVFDRSLRPITDSSALYGGCKGRISVTLKAYSHSGNHGISAWLNGVQKVGEGEPLGGSGMKSVESMFDMLDDVDLDDDFDDEEEEAVAPKTRTKAKIKKKKAQEPEELDEDLDDLDDDEDDEPVVKTPVKKATKKKVAKKPTKVEEPEDDDDDLYDDADIDDDI